MKINRTDFSEETIYVVKCPKCKEMIERSEDPAYEEDIYCDACSNTFELVDE